MRLVNLVLVDVSSMKTNRGNALSKKAFLPVTQCLRWAATSGRSVSLASRLFFMGGAKPVQQFAHGRAMHRYATFSQFQHQFVQRQVAVPGKPVANPVFVTTKLPDFPTMPLSLWLQ